MTRFGGLMRGMRTLPIALFVIFLFIIGCDSAERIDRLEKQNDELQSQLKKIQAASDYDLQAKCSRDAKSWFGENWARDKNTTLLDFTNHYNKALNKCFILVEYHYTLDNSGSWTGDITLWDVYENSKYATFSEQHFISFKPPETRDEVIGCEMLGTKCKSAEEFNNGWRPYMND